MSHPDRPPTPAAGQADAPGPPRPLPLLRTAAVVLGALLFVGCSGESSSAQGENAVPTERSTIRERADRARVKGDSAAPLQVFEIADFECSYCAQYYQETYPAIDSLYIETGKIRYVFITYPNANHPLAWPSAEASFCAGAAGKFWEMHDLLFERQSEWKGTGDPTGLFTGYAEEIGVDGDSFAACMEEDRPAPLQVRDLEQVASAGISGTPFFIINNEVSLQGAVPLDRFRTVLDSALAAQGVEPPPGGGRADGSGDGGGGDGGGG